MQRPTDNNVHGAKHIQTSTQYMKVANANRQPVYRQPAFSKGKAFLRTATAIITGIGFLSLPVHSYTTTVADEDESSETTNSKKWVLNVASVKGESTHFAMDGFEHGFGYDMVRNYANAIDKKVNLISYETTEEALKAVKEGRADMALTTSSGKLHSEMDVSSINLSCGRDSKLTKNGLHPKVNWSFASSNKKLAQKASKFVCDNNQIEYTEKLAKFYNQNLLKDKFNKEHFDEAMTNVLPSYKPAFQMVAETYNHDWELLVAVGYQESHLKANAVSPTGVKGLMMLTKDTAQAMGVANRRNPIQSIHGGAKYLNKMKKEFKDVPKSDRIFFALASYNMGPNAVKDIQQKLKAQGKNDKSWINVYAYMAQHKQENSRYGQCMHYVKNIRSYLETMKKQNA